MYSLGVVLYELLVGGVPYEGETFVTVALKHVNEPVPPVLERRPTFPLGWRLAVERAMAKSPDERFPSMQELVDELETCLDELDPGDEQATMISRRPVAAQRRRPPGGSDVWVSGRSPPCWRCSPSQRWPRSARWRFATVTTIRRQRHTADPAEGLGLRSTARATTPSTTTRPA